MSKQDTEMTFREMHKTTNCNIYTEPVRLSLKVKVRRYTTQIDKNKKWIDISCTTRTTCPILCHLSYPIPQVRAHESRPVAGEEGVWSGRDTSDGV